MGAPVFSVVPLVLRTALLHIVAAQRHWSRRPDPPPIGLDGQGEQSSARVLASPKSLCLARMLLCSVQELHITGGNYFH